MSIDIKTLKQFTEETNIYQPLEEFSKEKVKGFLPRHKKNPCTKRILRYIDRHNSFRCFSHLLNKYDPLSLNILALFRYCDQRRGYSQHKLREIGESMDYSVYPVWHRLQILKKDGLVFSNIWKDFFWRGHYTTAWGINTYISHWVIYEHNGKRRRNIPKARVNEMREFMIASAAKRSFNDKVQADKFYKRVDKLNKYLLNY